MKPKTAARIALEARLLEGSEGHCLLPEEVQSIIGVPSDGPGSPGYQVFDRASGYVLKETGGEINWRWRKDRYWCLTNEQKDLFVDGKRQTVTRQAKKAVRAASGVDYSSLAPERQAAFRANLGALQITVSANSRSMLNKLKDVEPALLPPPKPSELLKLIQKRQ